jgi:hypothetical protein
MPRKPRGKLNPIDRILRKIRPPEMTPGPQPVTQIEILKVCAFELFNDRPYHNHETWSDGYIINDHQHGVSVTAEDLDDAVARYSEAMKVAEKLAIEPETKCAGCGAEIQWFETESGKKMPVDVTAEKRIVRYQRGDKVFVKVTDTFTPHWATCKAEEFRKHG